MSRKCEGHSTLNTFYSCTWKYLKLYALLAANFRNQWLVCEVPCCIIRIAFLTCISWDQDLGEFFRKVWLYLQYSDSILNIHVRRIWYLCIWIQDFSLHDLRSWRFKVGCVLNIWLELQIHLTTMSFLRHKGFPELS